MSFYVNTKQIRDVAVLQCAGRLVRGQALSLLRDKVISLSPLRVIVLDLSEVEILDAGGLGLLVFFHNWACANGVQLKLVNPSKLVREMLKLTKLTSVLHITSVDDVIKLFCGVGHRVENVDRAVA